MIETPVPVCVTLYHFFPHPDGVIADVAPAEDSSQQQSSTFDAAPFPDAATATTTPKFISSSSRWYRLPEHSKQLLRRAVQLDIIQSSDGCVIYSSFQDNKKSVHPSWDLLDERFQWGTAVEFTNETQQDGSSKTITTTDNGSDQSILWNETYRSLSVRIILASTFHDTKDSANTTPSQQQKPPSSLPVTLAEAPLYPALLQRLPKSLLNSSDDPTMRSTMSLQQGPQQLLPITLPPNSLVIFFSDGSIRVSSQLYQFLLDHHVLNESNVTTENFTTATVAAAAPTDSVKDLDRFSDDVFATLDQVKNSITASIANTITSPSVTTTITSSSPSLNDVVRMPRSDISLLETEEDHHLDDAPSEVQIKEIPLHSFTRVEEEEDEDPLPSESVIVVHDLREEQRELQLLLEAEEQAWKQEIQAVQQDKAELERLVLHSQSIQAETVRIRDATYQEVLSAQQADFALEAQRIKLVMELRTLYPIQVKSDQRFCIRGLELPRDVHSAVASEEEVSAALGYLTHLVGMMSKYLAVPLRHRLYCCSSRSAISLDGVAVFPLFTSRAVEREELERGLRLLHRNVDCLLQTRDIRCSTQTHILGKMQRLYDKIIDGC